MQQQQARQQHCPDHEHLPEPALSKFHAHAGQHPIGIVMFRRRRQSHFHIPASINLHVPGVPPAVQPRAPTRVPHFLFDLIQQRAIGRDLDSNIATCPAPPDRTASVMSVRSRCASCPENFRLEPHIVPRPSARQSAGENANTRSAAASASADAAASATASPPRSPEPPASGTSPTATNNSGVNASASTSVNPASRCHSMLISIIAVDRCRAAIDRLKQSRPENAVIHHVRRRTSRQFGRLHKFCRANGSPPAR